MAKDFSKQFYKSKVWEETRIAYSKSVGNLCERCLARGEYVPGKIVHHKVHLTPNNISNPSFSLDWSNLELVCKECHDLEHKEEMTNGRTNVIEKNRRIQDRRYYVDDNGNVILKKLN